MTASVGIAPNKFLAKVASDLKKPDGFVIITEANKQEILDPLDISRIWGIGKVTEKALKAIGINTVGQLRQTDPAKLQNIFGNTTPHVLSLAKGIDHREVETAQTSKSMSSEETFAKDIRDKNILLKVLLNQVNEVAKRLREEKLEAKTITLKLRYDDFRTITRSSTIDHPTNITKILLQEAEQVFLKWYKKSTGALRLIGFGASGLRKAGSGQHQLFTEPEQERQRRLDEAFDAIRGKFGHGSNKPDSR